MRGSLRVGDVMAAATVASNGARGSDFDGWLDRLCGTVCRFRRSAGRDHAGRTVIRHAASVAKSAATLSVHLAPPVSRLVSAARLSLLATPRLESTAAAAVHLATVTSPTDKNLALAARAEK